MDFKVNPLFGSPLDQPPKVSGNDNRKLGLSGVGLLGGAVRRAGYSVAQSGFAIHDDRALGTRLTHKFINENKDLLYVIDQSPAARQRLTTSVFSTREDLVNIITETAHAQLTGKASEKITQQTLKEMPTVASMILLNTAGLRDLLNKDAGAVDLFTSSAPSPELVSFEKVATLAAEKFPVGSPLHNADFFKTRPKLAVYVLKHPDFLRGFLLPDAAAANAKNFKDKVDSDAFKHMLNNFVSEFADDAINNGAFTQAFFQTDDAHAAFAEFVAAGEFISDIPSPAEYLRKNPQFMLGNLATSDQFSLDSIMGDIVAAQARVMLPERSPADTTFLRSHLGVASLVVRNQDFRKALARQDAADDISALVHPGSTAIQLSRETISAVFSQFDPKIAEPKKNISIIV